LESSNAPEVKEFVEKQVELADEILAKCDTREKLKKKETALYNYPRYGCPTKRGNYCFYNHNTGLQSQAALYMQVIVSHAILGEHFLHEGGGYWKSLGSDPVSYTVVGMTWQNVCGH